MTMRIQSHAPNGTSSGVHGIPLTVPSRGFVAQFLRWSIRSWWHCAVCALAVIPCMTLERSLAASDFQAKPSSLQKGAPVPAEFQTRPEQADDAIAASPPADLPVLRTSYQSWLTNYFSSAILSDPSKESTHWGRTADPDSDGLANQLEYATGSSPIASSPPALLQLAFTPIGDATYMMVTFPRRKPLSDPNMLFTVEVTDNLETWNIISAAVFASSTSVSDADPIESVTYQVVTPVDGYAAMFVRLRVTPCLTDTDGDGLADCIETGSHVFGDPSSPGTSPSLADTDADGIKDGDETLGTLGGVNLPVLGCNPLQRNILIEYDWFDDSLDCASHSHQPTQTTVDKVQTAFAAAPVTNADGSTGIVMIQDRGQEGIFSGGNLVSSSDAAANIAGGVSGSAFSQYKQNNFAANRNGYFHYCLLPHRYNTSSTSSGQAEVQGDDLIVSLYCANSAQNVANTIMHELGHNLGLRHGGSTDCNYKPNYNSVMNYLYQFPGVDSTCDPIGDNVLDYSHGTRIAINENAIDENMGTCGNVAYDFNGNGSIESNVAFDLNSQETSQGSNCGGTFTVLSDYDDWGHLLFSGIGDSDGALLRALEIIDCDNPPPGS